MKDDRASVDELDLLAYADGLLPHEGERKARVEAHLAASPADAARVRAYRRQTAALEHRYGGRAREPVPPHLAALVAGEPSRRVARPGLWAAAVALTVTAAISGWLVRDWRNEPEWSAQAFLDQSYLSFAHSLPASALRADPADADAPLRWRSNRIALTLEVPNLEELGFAVTDKRTVGIAGDRMVRLTYAAADGRSFSMFLRPRWEGRTPEVKLVREGDVTLAYWLEGPLASALVSRLPEDETLAIAEAVRSAMNEVSEEASALEADPAGAGRGEPAVAGDGAIEDVPVGVSYPLPAETGAPGAG